MKTTNNNRYGRLAHRFQELRKAGQPRTRLILLIAMALSATYTTSSAQSIIGSPGAGFQTWKAENLNNNGAPYWDAFTKNQLGNKTSRNIGFCLTNSGDCVGINSALSAPGAIPFWGMTYNSAADTGGGQDNLVYFKSDNKHLRATLQLQLSTTATEINEFGWFETNSKGTTLGPIHRLFQGSGVPPAPSPVGKEVSFKPTKYFGFYFKDVSEGGCAVFTIASFTTDPNCSHHVFAVFATKPGSKNSAFEIAGLDPPGCGDGDCNLTLVGIQRLGSDIAQMSKGPDRDYSPRTRSHQRHLATARHSD
jgi:hypothetical protein